jgi:hypothetical protein
VSLFETYFDPFMLFQTLSELVDDKLTF